LVIFDFGGKMPNQTNDKKNSLRPDLATLLGLAIAGACMLGGLLLEGGKVADIQQVTAAMIVFGGTIGAVLVTTPLRVFLSALRRFLSILIARPQPFRQTLDRITRFAEQARRNGVASLEQEADDIEDAFLRKALNLAVDGTDLREIREIMALDMDAEGERREAEMRVWESAAWYAPTIGIIGAVLGLIQVMKHLDNITEVGRGIAVAFVATVYGVASANVVFLPAAGKLKAQDRELAQLREMMIEGVIAIAEGMNPRLIQLKLEAFLAPAPARRERKPREARAALASKLAVDNS
jgi:chemotaxis protein MotA